MSVKWTLASPALCEELLPLNIELINNESGDIGNVKATLSTTSPATNFTLDPRLVADRPSVLIDIPPIRSGSSQTVSVLVRSADAGVKDIDLTIFYETSLTVESEGKNFLCKCHRQEVMKLNVEKAFELGGYILSKKVWVLCYESRSVDWKSPWTECLHLEH